MQACVHRHTRTHTELGEGGRAGLRSRGQSQKGGHRRAEGTRAQAHTGRLSSGPSRHPGLWLGLEAGPAKHIWRALGLHSLTEGRKGAAGAASMLYCFPPGTLFLRERPKWYSGGGGQERAREQLGRGHARTRSCGFGLHRGPRTRPTTLGPSAPASPTPREAARRAAAAQRLAAGRWGQGTRARAPRGGRSGGPQAHD